MQDRIKVCGRLRLRIRTGGKRQEVCLDNVVTTTGLNIFAALVGGAGHAVDEIGVGSSSVAPDPANTVLADEFSKAITTVSQPATGQVKFAFSIDQGDAIGLDIQEFGLLADGWLVTRRVYPVGLKTGDMQIEGEWTIEFA